MSTTTTTRASLLDDQEESVRIAVRALGDMRAGQALPPPPPRALSRAYLIGTHGTRPTPLTPRADAALHPTPALSVASTSSTPALATPTPGADDDAQPDYISRVASMPLVDGALRISAAAYAQGKASSSIVKVGVPLRVYLRWR
jgi:hypothetical protein